MSIDSAIPVQKKWPSGDRGAFRFCIENPIALLADTTRLISEQARFLLTELVALYEADGLLTNDDTVVVAARAAWGEYLKYAAYVCQSDRPFREGLTHFGFYYKAQIQPTIPKIIEWAPNVVFTEDVATEYAAMGKATLATVIRRMLADGARSQDAFHGVMLLTPHDDHDTVRLGAPIANDTKTETGRTWAWTLGQRYTRLDRLQSGVVRTSEL